MHTAIRNAVATVLLVAASVYSDQNNSVNPADIVPAQLAQALAPAPDVKAQPKTDPFDNADAIPVPAAEGKTVKAEDVKYDGAQGTVEIHVNDASITEVLRMLSTQSQKNIIASKDVRGTITANLYGVTIKEALQAILVSNGYAFREQGNFIFVYTAKELREIERANRTTKTEVIRLFYTPASNAVNMIKPVLSADAQVSFTTPAGTGLSSGTGEVGGNSHAVEDMMVVTDYPENLEAVRRVIKEVDRRPQQILIEATILRAALSEDNAMGVDFNLLAGVNFNNLLSNNGGQVNGANTGTASAQVNGSAGSIGTGNSFSSTVPGGMKVGFVSDNVSVFLSALEGVTDTAVLANPKVLALNKQKGEVIVGRKDGYLTTTVTQTSTVQTVEFLDTGTRLIFRPYIADDGYIRMEIHPEDSSGGLTGANLPFKITTEVTSNVLVKDGHTILIGGLFRESSDTGRSQVPGLGNIPVAGYLFRNQRDRTTREEIIILLTPHIVKDESAFAEASEEMMKNADRLRVGVRRGMMPFGRERLAELSYEWARDEMKKPNYDKHKVLWYLNSATNLNPTFREAMVLKEQLTGEVVTAVDNTSMRHFISQAILAEKAAGVTQQNQPRSTPVTPEPATKPAGEPTADTSTTVFEFVSPKIAASIESVPAIQPTTQPTAVVPTVPSELPVVVTDADLERAIFNTSSTQPSTTVTVLPD